VKILVAEDELISRTMLQRDLEKLGYDVAVAENGRQAWDLFEEDEFQLVLSDWMMPEMNGLDLVRKIREAGRENYVYVILLTSRAEKSDIVEGMEAGADDFITKPFVLDELRVRLHAGERVLRLEQSLAIQNRRMKQDLNAAAEVQQSFLPAKVPTSPRARFAWEYMPCDELAGDTLNVFQLDETHIAFYVADVSGHGVRAALLSVTLSRVMTAQGDGSSVLIEVGDSGDDARILSPVEVVTALNRRFPMDEKTSQYFTLIYGILDTESLLCRCVCAGHPGPVLIAGDGSSRLIPVSGFPIGVVDEEIFEIEDHEIRMSEGDRFYMYSDGIPETFNAADEEFGTQRVLDALENCRAEDLEASISGLLSEIQSWREDPVADDDISIIGLEIVAREV